jgi:hypothetical protein
MTVDSSAQPNDLEKLQALLREQAATIARQSEELRDAKAELKATYLKIEQLKARLARLRRMQFGQSSEKLSREIEQLELLLEDVEESTATRAPLPVQSDTMQKPHRRPLPEALPREEIVHETACACPNCGAEMRKLGEDVT